MSRAARTPGPAPLEGRGPVALPRFTPERISEYRTRIAMFEDPDGRRWGVGTDCDRIEIVNGVGDPLIYIPTADGLDLALFASALAEAIGEARRWQNPLESDNDAARCPCGHLWTSHLPGGCVAQASPPGTPVKVCPCEQPPPGGGDDTGNGDTCWRPETGNCNACWHLWSLHNGGGCYAGTYPGNALTPVVCPCQHTPPMVYDCCPHCEHGPEITGHDDPCGCQETAPTTDPLGQLLKRQRAGAASDDTGNGA